MVTPPNRRVRSGFSAKIKVPMKYTVILERESDGGYVATVPVLPGCVSQGDTRDDVLKNIREAIELYVEDCQGAASESYR